MMLKRVMLQQADVTKTSVAIRRQPCFLTCLACEKILSVSFMKRGRKLKICVALMHLHTLVFVPLICVQILSFGGLFKQ